MSLPGMPTEPVRYHTCSCGVTGEYGHQSQLGGQPLTVVTFIAIGKAYNLFLSRQPLCMVPDRSRAQVRKLALTPYV